MANIWDPIITARGGKPIGEGKAPTAVATETAQQVEASIRAAEQQRQRDIETVCELAGRPEAAAGFVSAGTSISDVLAALAGTTATKPSERPTPEQRHQARLASKG